MLGLWLLESGGMKVWMSVVLCLCSSSNESEMEREKRSEALQEEKKE